MSVIKAISLNLNVKPKNDLFIIPYLDGKIYISERIADRYKENNITGLNLKLSQIGIEESSR